MILYGGSVLHHVASSEIITYPNLLKFAKDHIAIVRRIGRNRYISVDTFEISLKLTSRVYRLVGADFMNETSTYAFLNQLAMLRLDRLPTTKTWIELNQIYNRPDSGISEFRGKSRINGYVIRDECVMKVVNSTVISVLENKKADKTVRQFERPVLVIECKHHQDKDVEFEDKDKNQIFQYMLGMDFVNAILMSEFKALVYQRSSNIHLIGKMRQDFSPPKSISEFYSSILKEDVSIDNEGFLLCHGDLEKRNMFLKDGKLNIQT
ncbi:hypothetical protein CONCODRAFT_7394 [Conidiobolus coronatus NRRL 28638]|uniref:Uncharacterized protein n=1 Tax=Conidiobolus coronatus (strain ATCC 28846 / CBS 209.66 / NRRL 28638) TaxID=796925 RepID=A0A137P5F2_CONC2|nr:hypothetical protein CONCODRAFT_7394 [Conidiobolus coronatus NRRL 28638]|eukprot:KXN70151.1 hypothetical protein CONCODRAFT_7394 [Conidiobolus coronatus NRRL 28638]